ncbi:AI-2E family transporter [Psychroflexus sp. CAK57W]|uniref:AI-2E family transporter n=1 Tax=Psychroflexus curvus TaxID=2873595 RepID=UPI001CCDEFFC|nr:AI-2E family transporter [Psychroflexus curvus]MBZ9628002.1 AI-2E family transporter [Psychroflexus curvus]MBZ9787700.1 AI-2E family transporter [Psychroflexus curvus]
MDRLSPRLVRQLFILLIILSLGGLIFSEILPYISGVLGAITFYVLLRGLMQKMLKKGWNATMSVSILMLGSFILILLPVLGIIFMLSSKISKAIRNSEKVIEAVKAQLIQVEDMTGFKLGEQINSSDFTDWLSKNLQGLAGGTFEIFIAISIMYFLLYYMLLNQKKLTISMETYIPIDVDNLKLIASESAKKVKANAIGIPLVALFQGIISLIGYWIFGVPEPLFWFVITTIGSMIPFVGTAIGFIPVTLLMYYQGDTFAAIGVLIYGVAVVGSSDNIVRLLVLKQMANEHPLITLMGVIIGVPLFGFIGLIFGPLLLSLFLLVVMIYKKEYGEFESKAEKKLNENLRKEDGKES